MVCRGNELHVVYGDRTGDNRPWYSVLRLNTPSVERQPIPQTAKIMLLASPVPEDAMMADPKSEDDLPATSLPSAALGIDGFGPSLQKSSRPLAPIIVSVIPVLILVVGVIIVRRHR